MKRIQYHHYGGPEELRLEEAKQPGPEQGQIRVRVRAAAANPMDWKIRRGEMRMLSGFRFPRGLGHDFAGVVEAVGPGVERLKVGDEVLGVTSISKADAFAEFLVVYRAFNIAPYRHRFDVVFDTAGALSLSQCGAMLKRRGMSLHVVPTPAKLIGCLLPSRHHLVFGNPTPECMAGIAEAAERGKLVPAIGRIAPLSEAISAIVELEMTGSPKGKLVIVPRVPTRLV